MKKKLIITNYSIKNQVFNGHIPKDDNPYIESLIRNIKNSKWEVVKIQGNRYYKVYILNKKYRAVIQEYGNVLYLLIMYRHKNAGKATKNISKYDNASAEVIIKNTNKVYNDYKNGNYIEFIIE